MIKIQISAQTKSELDRIIDLLAPEIPADKRVKRRKDEQYFKAWITIKDRGEITRKDDP